MRSCAVVTDIDVATPALTLADGRSVHCDLLIGADGIDILLICPESRY